MSWFRIEGKMPQHAKYAPLSDAAFRLAITAGAWCADNMTDGMLPKPMVSALTRAPRGKALEVAVASLVEAKIWEDKSGSWLIHDFLDWNLSREDWEKKVKAAKAGGAAKAAKSTKQQKSSVPHGKPNGRQAASHMPAGCSAITLPLPLPDSDSDSDSDLSDRKIPPAPQGGHELKLHFVSEFQRLRGAEFKIPKNQWGRAMGALATLADTYTVTGAKDIVTKALASPWCNRVAPWEIVSDASRYLGEKPSAGFNGSKPEKHGPGRGNGPQPNAAEERNRYVARRFGETDDEFERRKADVRAGKRGLYD
jgi:hypothetical protein